MDQLIGPGEAARRLGVSTRTVQRWLRDGRLPAVSVGRRLKVRPGDLVAIAREARPGVIPPAPVRPIHRLLVANRGELVVRIARTCRRLGITSLALVSEDQRDAWWARQIDEIVPLAGTYLEAGAIIAAALGAHADAIHPGYGFLAERPDFAEAVLAAGLAWVGPPPDAMRRLGDKAGARRLATAAGVPVLEGYDGDEQADEVLTREAARIGYPVLLKPSAGGGGKGMHLVRAPVELNEALARARREARAAFGDDRMVLERYLERPRHVEVQLLCDAHGGGIHLGERDCSVQRRHQKVLEEAPAPGVGPRLRRRLGEAALRLARAAGYQGAGTAEFLLADDGRFAFLELNARLQVEHPVTEAVTGLDLVELQLRVAAGEPLPLRQHEVRLEGHAVEARLYAEDPWAGFLPATGQVAAVRWAEGAGLRIDAGVGEGDAIGTRYDPLMAKLIAHAADRRQALERLEAALAQSALVGVTTNRGWLRWLLARSEVRRATMRTDTLDDIWRPEGGDDVPEAAWPLASQALALRHDSHAAGRLGFRLNAAPALTVEMGGQVRRIPLAGATPPEPAVDWAPGTDGSVVLDLEGRAVRARLAPPPTIETAMREAHLADGAAAVTAPMPGLVLAVRVAEGETVEAHQVLLVLEAMKMENPVTAPADGRVARLLVRPGQAVQRGETLLELA